MAQCIAYNDDSIRDSSNDEPTKGDEITVRYRANVSELKKQLDEAIELLEKFKAKCDSLGVKIKIEVDENTSGFDESILGGKAM